MIVLIFKKTIVSICTCVAPGDLNSRRSPRRTFGPPARTGTAADGTSRKSRRARAGVRARAPPVVSAGGG